MKEEILGMKSSSDEERERGRWSGPDEELTREIIGAAIEVHQTLGAGFLEMIYRNALVIELRCRGLAVEMEKEVEVFFKGELVGQQRLDLLVEGRIILELKAVDALHGVHYAQLRSYLRATKLRSGLLINFSGTKADCRRVCWDP